MLKNLQLKFISKSLLKSLILMIGLFYILSVNSRNIYAYDDDTHFWLSYYLACKVGYTPKQAMLIASANISVDYGLETNPLFPHTIHPSDVRARLHALPSTKAVKKCRKEAKDRNPELKLQQNKRALEEQVDICIKPMLDEEQSKLWIVALNEGNPGVFLHFFQDRFAHRGFTSRLGHYRAGHLPDFLSNDPDKTRKMVLETIYKLRDFMREHWHLSESALPPEPNIQEIMVVVDKFIERNSSIIKLSPEYYEDWDWDVSDLKYKEIKELRRQLGDSLLRPWKAPDSFVAFRIVFEALLGVPIPKIWAYDLNSDGSLNRQICPRELTNITNEHGISVLVPEGKRKRCGKTSTCECFSISLDLGKSPV